MDKLYQDTEDVTAMLQKNVDRWIEEWKAEGEARGEARGETKERRRVAKRMLTAGIPLAQVAEITNLSVEELESLRDTVAN